MDVGIYLETYSEYDYGDVKKVNQGAANIKSQNDLTSIQDDEGYSHIPPIGLGRGRKAKQGTEGAYKADKLYKIPNVYEEIPNTDYESVHFQPTKPESKPTLDADPKVSLSQAVAPQPKACCGRSARFCGLLTVAMTVVIVILLVVLLTGIDLQMLLTSSHPFLRLNLMENYLQFDDRQGCAPSCALSLIS